MNIKQKIVIAVATVLVALSGLFPPFEGEYRRQGDNLRKYIGYHSIFSPPSDVALHTTFFPDDKFWLITYVNVGSKRHYEKVLFKFLKEHGAIGPLTDYEEFKKRVSDKSTREELFQYMKDNDLIGPKTGFDEFHTKVWSAPSIKKSLPEFRYAYIEAKKHLERRKNHYRSEIILSRVWVQVVTIIVTAMGLVLILGDRRR